MSRKTAPTAPPVLAISYLRFSSRRQEDGDSLRRQSELAAAYCQRKGWTLSDTNYEDLGVSAWKGKNAIVGNLGEFLKAVEAGAVKPGTALIVESLDRISRQGIDEGYDTVKRILKAGILLVTLTPEREFDVTATKSLSKGALDIQLILERAAEESERKSERVRAAWKGKRDKARAGVGVVAGAPPAWVRNVGGKLELIPERAAAVQRIYALAAAGHGRRQIIRALKRDGIPPFGVKGWVGSYVQKILTDRRTLGEYQPRDSDRKVAGEVMFGYFPAVVTQQQWDAAKAGADQRMLRKGGRQKLWTPEEDEAVRTLSVLAAAKMTGRTRAAVYQRRGTLGVSARQERETGANFVNPFAGLVRNAREPGDAYFATTRMDPSGLVRILLNYGYSSGNCPQFSFQYSTFERGLLSCLKEVKPQDVLPPAGTGPDGRDVLKGQLATVRERLAEVEAEMMTGKVALLAKVAGKLEEQERELSAQLEAANARAAVPASAAWAEFGSLVDMLDQAPDQADIRLRLRAALRRMVEEIRLLVVPRGRDRLAAVQVFFSGGARREYLLWHRAHCDNGKARRPGWYKVRSISTAESETLPPGLSGLMLIDDNLRDPDEAARALSYLESLPKDLLEEAVFGGEEAHAIA
jgi:DNA invertase Pin-like site-specific DNA recombinase